MAVYSLRQAGITNFAKYANFRATNVPFISLTIEYLVIAGGGSGSWNRGCSGGAGGYRSSVVGQLSGGGSSAEPIIIGDLATNYLVTIGAGAPGGVQNSTGSNGANSVFSTITSLGGGSGGYGSGTSGGSGGGAAQSSDFFAGGAGTTGQGFAGGSNAQGGIFPSGGGGGAGGAGGSPTRGAGQSSNITGTSITRALGGSGHDDPREAGAANTGTGGATGARFVVGEGSTPFNGLSGGSGVVILRYPSNLTITIGAGLTGTTATVGANRVTTITAGTGNVSWAA